MYICQGKLCVTIYELYVSTCVFEQPSVFECMFVYERASLVAQMVKSLPVMQETWVQSLGWEEEN